MAEAEFKPPVTTVSPRLLMELHEVSAKIRKKKEEKEETAVTSRESVTTSHYCGNSTREA